MPGWRRRAMRSTKPFAGKKPIIVVGVDSETQQGPPISIQFFSFDQPKVTKIIQTTERTVTKRFFQHMAKTFSPDYHYRVYGHFLDFDLLSFLWERRLELIGNHGAFEFTYNGWDVSGVYGRPTFARVTSITGHYIEYVDSALWFRGSLDAAAERYCPDVRKYPRPEGLGTDWFSIKDDEFAAYAMRDAEIAARLGALIEGFHQEHELRPSMSLAAQASQIFRQRYIADPIAQCPERFIEPAIAAYHGGKNNLVAGCSPAWHENSAMYDLSSAYPYAMTQLPTFTKPKAYRSVNFGPRVKSVPVPGIYCVSGHVAPCKWPIFFSHEFKPLRNCDVDQLWVHGYELNEALATGEFKPNARIHGLCYDADNFGDAATARFARDFYEFKNKAEDPISRFMYKILLNSLSGKFIQTRPEDTLDDAGNVHTQHVAGGLFQPFIAGAITAHTRAVMHQVEHAYKALHTATDGIIAADRKRMPNLGLPKKGLGSLNVEMRGNVVLMRTKLYIGYDQEPDGLASQVFDGWNIRKYALHGFQGRVHDLEEMILSGRRWYTSLHRIGLREAVKHGTTPNDFTNRQMNLRVGPVR